MRISRAALAAVALALVGLAAPGARAQVPTLAHYQLVQATIRQDGLTVDVTAWTDRALTGSGSSTSMSVCVTVFSDSDYDGGCGTGVVLVDPVLLSLARVTGTVDSSYFEDKSLTVDATWIGGQNFEVNPATGTSGVQAQWQRDGMAVVTASSEATASAVNGAATGPEDYVSLYQDLRLSAS